MLYHCGCSSKLPDHFGRGAHAPPRVVSGALAGNLFVPPGRAAPGCLWRGRQRRHARARVVPCPTDVSQFLGTNHLRCIAPSRSMAPVSSRRPCLRLLIGDGIKPRLVQDPHVFVQSPGGLATPFSSFSTRFCHACHPLQDIENVNSDCKLSVLT